MPTQNYLVRPGFYLHRGKSTYRPGSIVLLTETEQKTFSHQIELYPLSPEVVASRTPKLVIDDAPKNWAVRKGFVVWRAEVCHVAGEIVSMTYSEARPYLHAIEPAANYVPEVAPEPEDGSTEPYRVRGGFHCEWRDDVHKGGTILHLTKRQAAARAHMLEDAGSVAPVEAVIARVKGAVKAAGNAARAA